MSFGDILKAFNQSGGQPGAMQPMQSPIGMPPIDDKADKNQNLGLMLYALGGALKGDKNFVQNTMAIQQMQEGKKKEEERKRRYNEMLAKMNPESPLYQFSKLVGSEGVDKIAEAQFELATREKKTIEYKPELVEYQNKTEEPIKIGNIVIQPGTKMPFNVSIPEIANSISGMPGLEEVKQQNVYTRQGSLYTTPEGDYREIITGDQRVFDGPAGRFDAGQFFAKYPESRSKTSGEEQRYIPDFKTFTGLNKELTTEERSLKKLDSYWKNITDTNVGVERLGDQISTWFKTLAGRQDLTVEQLARGIAEGKLQGLIGANRIDTVGGGVMTEKDAWRIISRLGGDVDALQNPAIVGPLLQEMYQDKVDAYNEDIKGYNIGVESKKYTGYSKRSPISSKDVAAKFSLLPEGIPIGSIREVSPNGVVYYIDPETNKKYIIED